MHTVHAEACKFLEQTVKDTYETGIILGTGLGGLVKKIEPDCFFDYDTIPNFPVSTVEFHHGKLFFGKLAGKKIIAMQGRFHYYEGYNHYNVTFPLHILKSFGVKNLIISNACGALNPTYRKTELMLLSSYMNFHFANPLRGAKFFYDDKPVKQFSQRLLKLAEEAALENGIDIHKGVYASVQGPNLETRAEYRMLRKIGADVVGMSTIPEIITASNIGIETLGISIITDEGFPDTLKVALLEHIIESAEIAEKKLMLLTEKLVEKF